MSTKNIVAHAAREAAVAATRRAAEIAALCAKRGQPGEMTAMILSGKSVADVEAELKRKANVASWAQAASKVGVPS